MSSTAAGSGDAGPTRHVSYDDIVAYCARCAHSLPAVAASTAARDPATVTLDFACPGGYVHVTVKELSFQDGGLGFRLFPAAVWHAAWLAQHFLPLVFRTLPAGEHPQPPLRLLELGAGLGLCGLAVAVAARAAGVPAHVTLSDFSHGLLTAAEAACEANGVKHCTSVAFLDWVADAAAAVGSLSRESNAEYFRVIAGSPYAHSPPLQLQPDAAFDVIIATEVLYEAGAATALPAVILRRLDPQQGGRFCTLMAVRDTELLRTCVATLAKLSPSVLPGLQLRMCVAPASALPLPSRHQKCADAAAGSSQPGGTQPLCEGQKWMSAAECDAVICSGPTGREGPLQSAWFEALWTPDASCGSRLQAAAVRAHCCGRNARGLACPCARR